MENFNGYSNTEDENYKSTLERLICCDKSSSVDDWMEIAKDRCFSRWFFLDDQRLPSKIWTVVHHLAYIAPTEEIVDALLEKQAYMLYLKDGEDRMPVEHLPSEGLSGAYRERFKPKYRSNILAEDFPKIEENFHKVIRQRMEDFGVKAKLILPNISVLLSEYFACKVYFGIPGMYGGFTMELVWNDTDTGVKGLETSSWSRICGGSGQKHLCTAQGFTLVDEGFV